MPTDNSGSLNTANNKCPSDYTKQIIFSIRRLIQANGLYTKELNKKFQLSAAQLNCISTLYEHGPLPPSKIANHMMVKSSTVTGVVDRLEKKGHVKRLRDSPDRRVIIIQLTETGEKLAKNAPPPIQQKIIDGLKQTENSKKKQIAHSLNMLTDMLDVRDLEVK
ncbi:MAG: MarR family transcriptional regulator [Pseudomonadota bacterium]|nr:MarR family transcriptional regulator [Pseudomonadota bacterium]